MNPFISHHILKDLPFDLMKQPTREGLEQFVEKKRQQYLLFSALLTIIGIALLVINLMIFKPELGAILNLINPVFWFFMAVFFFRKAKATHLSMGELDDLMQTFSSNTE